MATVLFLLYAKPVYTVETVLFVPYAESVYTVETVLFLLYAESVYMVETVLCLWGLRDLQAQGSMVSHASTPPPSIQLTVSLEEPDIPHFTSCNVRNCLLIAPCLWDGILAALLQTFSSHIIHLHISAGWLPEMPLHPLTPFMDSRPDTADFSAIFLKTCLYNLGFHNSATRTLCFY